MSKKAYIIVGLGYGDEGKGLCTEYLCSNKNPTDTIVIRYNGGHQAGHTVVTDNANHIHSSLGSGTLLGFPSFISKYCTIYPTAMWNEYQFLIDKKITPQLIVDPEAKLTTPYDVAYNRVVEKINNHGSCGWGVGATMKRHCESPYKIFAKDLKFKNILVQKIASILKYYLDLFKLQNRSMEFVTEFLEISHKEFSKYYESIDKLVYKNKISINSLNYNLWTNFIFEGAQGIMLDMDHGFFPHVTYSNTTSKNAINLCKDFLIYDIDVWYITRTHQTRHGCGPTIGTENLELSKLVQDNTNVFNKWQGEFKISNLNFETLNYALESDLIDIPVNKNILITWCDVLTIEKSFLNEMEGSLFLLKFKDNIYMSFGPKSSNIIKYEGY